MNKKLRISKIRNITPGGMDGYKHRLYWELLEPSDSEDIVTSSGHVDVSISGTLQAVWGILDSDVPLVSGSAAIPKILEFAADGELEQHDEITLSTSTMEKTAPSLIYNLTGALLDLPDNGGNLEMENSNRISFLSIDISEVRDQINTLSTAMIGGRLLMLPQERALIDMYKPAETSEKFTSRLQSLAGLVISIDTKLIDKIDSIDTTKIEGSLNYLNEYLSNISEPEKFDNIIGVYKRLNDLRQGYPTHTDTAKNVISAYDYFGIRYPVTDYEAAWERIMNKYLSATRELLNILADYRERTKEIFQ